MLPLLKAGIWQSRQCWAHKAPADSPLKQMKRRLTLNITSAVLYSLLVGCYTTKVIMQGEKRNPIPVAQVKVYEAIPPDARAIGLLMATAGGKSQGSMDKAVERLKVKAASLGANGIVFNTVGSS